MRHDLTAAYNEVMRACDDARTAAKAAGIAADQVLARSNLWLALHPIQHRRLRRKLIAAREEMLEKRARMERATALYWKLHDWKLHAASHLRPSPQEPPTT